MAAIGSIRKHGVLLMVIIGVALLAFLLGDFTQTASVFSSKNILAKVNGTRLDEQYRVQYEQNMALWKIVYDKSSLEESENYQIHELTWNNVVDNVLLDEQLEALGLIYTQEMAENATAEMVASLRTQQPNQLLYKLFTVIASVSNAETAMGFIANAEEYKNQENVRDFYNAYKAIEFFNLAEKKRQSYFALLQHSQHFSDRLAAKMAADNQTALVSLAVVNPNATHFNNINVTVTPKEVKTWYKEHKNRYQVKEDSRDLTLAIFPIAPTTADLQAIEDSVNNTYARLEVAESLEAFNIDHMFGQVDSNFHKKGDITLPMLDSIIFSTPVGSTFAPYNYENQAWYYGKVFASAFRPDSVQVAYLVVDYKTEQNQQATRTEADAKATTDSLKTILESNPNAIFSLMPNYLGGRNAADTTMWVAENQTYRALYDSLLLSARTNSLFVQNNGAYVLFQVRQMTQPVEKRMFAIYPTEIKASDATVNSIRSEANQLAAESTSAQAFVEAANKKGIQVVQGDNVTSMTATISQVQNCRDIVSWAFGKDAKADDISDVTKIGDQMFVVAALRSVKEKGIAPLEAVEQAIENELMTMKKIEAVENLMNEELQKGTSLYDLSSKYSLAVRDSVSLGFCLDSYQNAQVEDKAIGKIFCLPADQKAHAVSGKYMVYVVDVKQVTEGQPSPDLAFEKMLLRNMVNGRMRNEMVVMQDLKDRAKIIDNRYRFYVK